jgi:Tol biopolymer transport system component
LIDGATLRDRKNKNPLNLREILNAALQVAAALNAAHEAGIVHRDIKPENVMLREDGLVKVLDFGLAKLSEKQIDESSPEEVTIAMVKTEPGMIMGTFAYMSPEQARGKEVDGRSDIWSLGVMMFELLSGRRPFEGEEAMDIVSSILKEPTPPLRESAPNVPRQLERIVEKTLRKDLDHRYQTVKDLHIDLEDLCDELKLEAKLGQSVEATTPAAPQPTDSGRINSTFQTAATIVTSRRFNLFHAALFAIAVIGIVGAGVWIRSSLAGNPVLPGSYKVVDVESWSAAPGELFSNAAFSPDGKLIAFSSTKSKRKNIWVKQTNSTEALQVTTENYSDKDPIWSPNGQEIAFFSERRGGADGSSAVTGVWRVSALGGQPKSIGPINDGSSELRSWVESGKIYFQSQGDLYAMDTVTGVSEKVTTFQERNIRVEWIDISADEKQIAYVARAEAGWELYSSNIKNEDPIRIASGIGKNGGVAWLPENQRVFYSSAIDGIFQIFVLDIGSGEPARITASATDNVVVDASRDGHSILFSSAKEESNIWSVNIAEKKEAPVTRSVNSELWPSISPSGGSIIFQSVRNLNRGTNLFSGAVMIKAVGGTSDQDRSTQLVEQGYLPTWAPDGTVVAFLRNNEAEAELFMVNAAGGGEKLLSTGGISRVGYSISPYNSVQQNAFAWSPEGTRIAYSSNRNGADNIWTIWPSTGDDRLVTNNSDANLTFTCPIWASDGKRLAFFSQTKRPDGQGKTERAIWIVEVEKGSASKVFSTAKPIRMIGWSSDETELLIAETEKLGSSLPPETIISRVSSGASTEIARLKNAYYYNIFLSVDRKQIAYAARNNDLDDIWLMPASGGTPQSLTENNDFSIFFSRMAWKNDGSAIIFGKQTRFSLLSMITEIK